MIWSESYRTILTESYLYPKDYAQAATTAQQGILSAMLGKNIQAPVFQTTKSLIGKSERLRMEFANFGTNLYKAFREYYRQGVTLKHTYLWGYNHTLPVAVIDGLDYSETLSLTGQTDLNSQLAGYRRLFRFPRRLLECDARCQHGDGKDNLHGGLHG